jgi:hypothetical protein
MTLRFKSPRNVRDVAECAFYHYMDLPGYWDLRPTIDEYLGRFDFRDKRALDVGAASGYLTFEMEKRGAGMVLPHLRDPFRALQSASRLSSEWVIITQQCLQRVEPACFFQPGPEPMPDAITWWTMSEGCVDKMLRVLGFKVVSLTGATSSAGGDRDRRASAASENASSVLSVAQNYGTTRPFAASRSRSSSPP